MEIKDKLTEEKNKFEKEEMKDRYKAMDALVRTEFERKDEAMKLLQTKIENEMSLIHTAIKQEESSRNQNEAVLREDVIKFQDILRKVFFLLGVF